jgi:hypothetical protein
MEKLTADIKLMHERKGYEIWLYEKFETDEWKLIRKFPCNGNFIAIDEKPAYITQINYSTINYLFLNTDMNHKTKGACYQIKKTQ